MTAQLVAENRESFMLRLGDKFSAKEIANIMFAYDLAKAAHRSQLRKNNNRYFEHIRKVAIILLDELKYWQVDSLIAMLLHDTLEDTGIFGNTRKRADHELKEAKRRIHKVAGNNKVFDYVLDLTKRPGYTMINYSKQIRRDPINVLHKLIDCLANLRDSIDLSYDIDKHRKFVCRQMKEIVDVYIPLAKEYSSDNIYAHHIKYLYDNIVKGYADLDYHFTEKKEVIEFQSSYFDTILNEDNSVKCHLLTQDELIEKEKEIYLKSDGNIHTSSNKMVMISQSQYDNLDQGLVKLY